MRVQNCELNKIEMLVIGTVIELGGGDEVLVQTALVDGNGDATRLNILGD